MASTFANLIYHVVFSTKNREPMISPAIELELHAYLGGTVKSEGGVILAVGGRPDHVHLLMKLKPSRALSDMIRLVKSSSSKWMNEQNRILGRFAWQDGFGAFTVRESQARRVVAYVSDQEEHHRTLSFREELVSLLKKHGVVYEERYLLG